MMNPARSESLPESIQFQRSPEGVEVTLLPPPRLRRSRKAVAASVLAALFLVALASLPWLGSRILGQEEAAFLFFPALALVLGMLIVGSEFRWDHETAVVEVRDGFMTLVRAGGIPPRQWKVDDLWSIQARTALGNPLAWVLVVMDRQGKSHEFFKGRPRIELEWLAGILRAATARVPVRRSEAEGIVERRSGGECQVCGTTMEARIVWCAKCRTPHHEECWVYNGVCSTYGCREIRFTRT